jgi:hypothetical protein
MPHPALLPAVRVARGLRLPRREPLRAPLEELGLGLLVKVNRRGTAGAGGGFRRRTGYQWVRKSKAVTMIPKSTNDSIY